MNTDSKNVETEQCTIPSFISRFFNKMGWKLVQKTCKHTDRYNIWTDYQDRYYEDYCPTCKLTTFESMD